MVSAVSEGVRINVEVFFQKDYSNPLQQDFMFAYRITIINLNNFPIQLLRRNWEIFDSNGSKKVVDGEGVIGVQPVIKPENQYTYVSGCNIKSDIGKMQGFYSMINLFTKSNFKVTIPSFNLIYPFKNN